MTNINTVTSEKPLRQRGRPRKTTTSLSREQLLEHAFNRFAERGFEGVSVRELAADLGVSDSLFHHYFGPKEQLWHEALTQMMAPLQSRVLEVLQQRERLQDPVARLRESTRLTLMWGVTNRRIFQLVFREGGQDSSRGILLRQYFEVYQNQVEAALLEARQQGRLRDIPLNSAHAMILGAARMLVDPSLMRTRMKTVLESEEGLTTFVEGIIDTLFLGLLREPEPNA